MKDSIFYRNLYKLKNDIIIFLKRYKFIILLLICIFILGVVTGIFTASNYSGSLELENIPDDAFIDFLCSDKGSFSLFFSYLIALGIAILLIIFLNKNWLCSFINYIYIFVRGYILGFTIFAVIGLYSLAGIISAIIIIMPFWLLINFIIILISGICIARNRLIRKFGKHCYCNYNPKNFLILLSILLVGILFLYCMLLPIIKITIIVN